MDQLDAKLCPEIGRVNKPFAPSLCLHFWLGDGFCLRVLFTNRTFMGTFIMEFAEGWVKVCLPFSPIMNLACSRHEQDCYSKANERDGMGWSMMRNKISWTRLFLKIALKYH
jgi:hypothetical protein